MLRQLTLACGLLAGSFSAQAAVVTYTDFSDTSGLSLNGSASTQITGDGSVLRLTPAASTQSGSAFSSATVNAADFSTYFQFRITQPGGSLFDCNTSTGADGIVFVAQSVSSSVGGAGGGIGYAGIADSVGVEFDTWCNGITNDPSSNHVGIITGGSVVHGAGSPFTANVSPDFDNGELWHAWVDYDGSELEVRLSENAARPADALLTRALDIPSLLGGVDDAFVGFTSGTGGAWGNHDIVFWEYRDQFAPVGLVPVPGSALLLLFGGLLLRRKLS